MKKESIVEQFDLKDSKGEMSVADDKFYHDSTNLSV